MYGVHVCSLKPDHADLVAMLEAELWGIALGEPGHGPSEQSSGVGLDWRLWTYLVRLIWDLMPTEGFRMSILSLGDFS